MRAHAPAVTLHPTIQAAALTALREGMDRAAALNVVGREVGAVIVRETLREQGFRIARAPGLRWHVRAEVALTGAP